MKKMIFLVLVILSFFSCKKKDSGGVYVFPANIIAGDTLDTRMTFARPAVDTVTSLDLDNDGVTDLRLVYYGMSGFGGGVTLYSGDAVKALNASLQILTTGQAATYDSPFKGYLYACALHRGDTITGHPGVWNPGNSLLSELWMKSYTYPPMVAVYDSAGPWYHVTNRYLAFILGERPGWILLIRAGEHRIGEYAIMR